MKKISLRAKLTFAFIVITALLSGGLSVFNYTQLRRQLFTELTSKLGNIAFLGAQLLDKSAFASLAARIDTVKTNVTLQSNIEKTVEYRKIYDQLNFIRDASPKLIKYIYTFVPSSDTDKAYYAVDGDALKLIKRADVGLPTEEISRFAGLFDLSNYPTTKHAIESKTVTIEDSFSYDTNFKIFTLSGYAPVIGFDGKTAIGYLGVDISAQDVEDLLGAAVKSSLYMTAIIVLLSILVSIYFGRLLTKALVALDTVVTQFSEEDFTVRVNVVSDDEVGRLGFSLNKMAEIIVGSRQRLQSLLEAYSRFVPQAYIRLLGKTDVVELKLGDYLQKQMTVLFTDIRGFTSLSEKMSPYENFAFINSFLKRMGPIVRENSGIIDKYIGDAIMALFDDQPENAVSAAIHMFEELERYNKYRSEKAFEPIDMGVGIHSGSIMVGTVGEKERMDGTVIGDSVNLASRLESLTKMYGAHIIISETTVRLLPNRSRYKMRFIDRVIVKGKTEPITLIEILDGKTSEVTLKKIEFAVEFENAARDFHNRVPNLKARFEELAKKNPEDKAVALYLERCDTRAQGLPIEGVDSEYKKKA